MWQIYLMMCVTVIVQAPDSIASSADLGGVAALTAEISNSGPSTIQNASVVINFPARLSDVDGNNYLLYPSTIDVDSSRAEVTCEESELDPEDFDSGPAVSET